jgi:hypothetical protein
MVLNRKSKQQRKNLSRTKRLADGCGPRKSKNVRSVQHGGVSPACVLTGATGTDVLLHNVGANIHNTNPQASLDLDNNFMKYGGAVPLGSNILQGGANCGDEGKGGVGNGKSETFKQYIDELSNKYMVGGGFTTDPSQYIAGKPVYSAYDDCCPPAIVNNQLVMGAPNQPVCGLGAIKGGARRRHNKSSSSKHKNKRSSKTTKKNHNSKRKSNKRKSNKRKSNKRKTHSHRQRGGATGDFVYSATRSTPAPMSEAFNGPQGVFRYPDDMMSRTFNEVQPNYSVNAV